MRRLLMCGVAVIAMVAEAGAADMPDFLRGSQPVVTMPGAGPRWDGFYAGAQVGASIPGIDFASSTTDVGVLAAMTPIRSRTVSPLGNQDSTGIQYGGFIGYNTVWDNVAVFGIEGTYNWIDKSLTAVNSISGSFGTPTDNLVYTGAGSATARIIDYGTLRIRGGWAAGMFMPYATFGLAVGRMDISRSVLITPSATSATPPGTVLPPPIRVSDNLLNQFGYGWAAGLGLDFCLWSNLFMRAEYEYVQFPDVQGLQAHMHNVRLGAAYKF